MMAANKLRTGDYMSDFYSLPYILSIYNLSFLPSRAAISSRCRSRSGGPLLTIYRDVRLLSRRTWSRPPGFDSSTRAAAAPLGNDWKLIAPYLEENERLFGIRIDRDLLTVDGVQRSPAQVYRKVMPQKDAEAEAERKVGK